MGTGAKNYAAPDWITAEFIQDVLKEYFKDDKLEVHEIVVKSVTAGGEMGSGFASEMHRVVFNLKRNDVTGKFSVIIKDHPKGYTGAVAHKSKLFKREIMAYKEILPRVEELLASIGDTTKIAPACYYTTETPEPFLILEDMNLNGFENFEKGRLLNLDYVLPTVEKLAKLHACSAVIAADNSKIMEFFEDNLMFHVDNETKEPDNVVLLDFQLAYYGSPAMDLNYFLYGSLNENVRKVHMKYIVRAYHCILKDTLVKLNYDGDIPTLKDLTIEIIKNSLQGVIAATCLTPLIFMEKDGFESLENLTSRTEEGDEMRRKNVENPKYRAFLQRTIKEFELCGFLDV